MERPQKEEVSFETQMKLLARLDEQTFIQAEDRYFDRDGLLEAIDEGTQTNYNRQLSYAAVEEGMETDDTVTVDFAFIHSYIEGVRADNHVRVMLTNGAIIDISAERWLGMPKHDN